MPFKIVLMAFALLLTASGCATQSKYASESSFASVYTGRISSPDTPLVPFPHGLQTPALSPDKPYFIEFRARNALSYGHASVAFGRLDEDGNVPRLSNGDLKPGSVEISGLHPASDSNAVYSAGHFVPVLASTGPSDGDDEEAYLLARYRINLTREEFLRTVAIVEQRKRTTRYWNGPLNSCVTYLRRIAEDMGLKTPSTPHLPQKFVETLAAINEPA